MRTKKRTLENGVEVISKENSSLMKFLSFLLFFNKKFMSRFWTTMFGKIYSPSYVDLSDPNFESRYSSIIRHEMVHAKDQKRWSVFFYISYLLLPLPMGLAWFRWYWERKAYLESVLERPDFESKNRRIEWIANSLGGSDYLFTWPKPWIKKWFWKQVEKEHMRENP